MSFFKMLFIVTSIMASVEEAMTDSETPGQLTYEELLTIVFEALGSYLGLQGEELEEWIKLTLKTFAPETLNKVVTTMDELE